MAYSYDRPAVPAGTRGNACDIGIFGPEGCELGNRRGFRGWSGGSRDRFSISATEATPGYVPGPLTPGTWHVVLGPYTIAPQGLNYTVRITLTDGEPGAAFVPRPAPTSAPARQRGRSWYRGDLHLHTVFSDGRRTPDQLVAAARAAGLDFIVPTEHNTHSAQLQWGNHATDDLLVLNGEEVTTRSGHWPAIGLPAGTWIDWRHPSGAPIAAEVHRAGGLVVAAHPFAPCLGCAFEHPYDLVDLIEVWNGPWTPDDEATLAHWHGMLRSGRWVPLVGGSDAHTPEHAVGHPHTVVLADDLRREDLLAGLAAGRSYAVESSAVSLSFTATGGGRSAGIGERLRVDRGTPVTVELAVSGAPGTTVTIYDQAGPQQTGADRETVRWTTCARYSRWVRAEVRRTGGNAMVALTNPVFLGVA